MGNEPLGRYGRRPFFPLFSFFSRGRGRYAVLAAALVLASLPLAVPGPMFEAFLGFPPVAAVLRLAGFGPGAGTSAGAAAGLLRVESGRRDGYAESGRFRDRNCGAACRNPSPLGLVKADMSALTARVPPGRIAGAIDPSDAEGLTDSVDLGKPGSGGARVAGGGPYRGGALAASGVIGRGAGLYSSALKYGDSMVPPPGRPQRVGSGY
ncbi:MAG TPA: hypothetical protein PL037_06690, partial [Elusimicrobiales bacterium]|nr:hypothetical protein [Elusimicrobiales bacterium]